MTALRKSLADYLELRRGMGFKLCYYERRLGRFLSFVEERGAKRITTQLAIQFATHDSDLKPRTIAGRLSEVRGFARYQLAHDPATEVPPQHLLANGGKPAKAYIYSEAEIVRLLQAARNQPELDEFPGPLCPRWRGSLWYCYFGLLAMTGMRLSEAASRHDARRCAHTSHRRATQPTRAPVRRLALAERVGTCARRLGRARRSTSPRSHRMPLGDARGPWLRSAPSRPETPRGPNPARMPA